MKSSHKPFAVKLLDPDDFVAVAKDHERRILAGLQAGRTIAGGSLGTYKSGPRKGRPITLQGATGALHDGIKASRAANGARVDSEAPHSRHVFERFAEVMQIDAEGTAELLERRFVDKQEKKS